MSGSMKCSTDLTSTKNCDSSVGKGEHPQFIEEMDKQLEKMSNAEEKLITLNKHFNNTQI